MIALKFTQIFTISMPQILIDMKGFGEKNSSSGFVHFFCLDGKGKIKQIMLFIKCLKICKCKRLHKASFLLKAISKLAFSRRKDEPENPGTTSEYPPISE